jgi:hypothetical protein
MTGMSKEFFTVAFSGAGQLLLVSVCFFTLSGLLYLRKSRTDHPCENSVAQPVTEHLFGKEPLSQVKPQHAVMSAGRDRRTASVQNSGASEYNEFTVPVCRENRKIEARSPQKAEKHSACDGQGYLNARRLLDSGIGIEEIAKQLSMPRCEIELMSYLKDNYHQSFQRQSEAEGVHMENQAYRPGSKKNVLVKGAIYEGNVLERGKGQQIRVELNGRCFWCNSRVAVQPGETVLLKVTQLQPKIVCRLVYRKDPRSGNIAYNI